MQYKNSLFNVFETHGSKEYLINTLSKSVVLLLPEESARIKELLQNPNPVNKKDVEYIRILAKNEFLVSQEKDEISWVEYQYYKQWFNTADLFLTFLPTFRCNFSCPYCFESEKALDMDEQSLSVFLGWLLQVIKTHKSLEISFFGGEPLLKISFIEKICCTLNNAVKNTGCIIYYGIISNAYLLTNSVIKKLLFDCNLRRFQITFDGPAKFHNKRRKLHSGASTFEKVLAHTKALIKIARENDVLDLGIVIRVNYDDENIDDIKEFLCMFTEEEKKYCTIYFRQIFNTKSWKSKITEKIDLHELYSLAKAQGFTISNMCNTSFSYCEGDGGAGKLTIYPDLTVGKCANDYGFKRAEIGYINSDSKLILDDEKLRQWGEKNPFKDEKCLNCAYLPICVGSCPLVWSKQHERTCFHDKNSIVDEILVNT